MACCNSHAGQAKQSISNSESVLGMKYHARLHCPLSEMHQCINISEQLRGSPDERLPKLVDKINIINDIDADVLMEIMDVDKIDFLEKICLTPELDTR